MYVCIYLSRVHVCMYYNRDEQIEVRAYASSRKGFQPQEFHSRTHYFPFGDFERSEPLQIVHDNILL